MEIRIIRFRCYRWVINLNVKKYNKLDVALLREAKFQKEQTTMQVVTTEINNELWTSLGKDKSLSMQLVSARDQTVEQDWKCKTRIYWIQYYRAVYPP
jgi:mRNA-degrading endonuclease YafQ of YafQ-DinJ toxin-antitoxin module